MQSLVKLLIEVLHLYSLIVITSVIMSWLVAFNVINTRNRFVYMVVDTVNRLTEPALKPIRSILPSMGGLDLSPLILLLLLWFGQNLLAEYGLRGTALMGY